MERIESIVREVLPQVKQVLRVRSVGGGSFSTAQGVTCQLDNGEVREWFVKRDTSDCLNHFQCEFEGLRRLRAAGAIDTVRPIAAECVGDQAVFVSTWVEDRRRGRAFFERFAEQLADLHRVTLGHEIGLDHDNFLGMATQTNPPASDWVEFVAEHRLGCQLRWAVDANRIDGRLKRDLQSAIEQLDRVLAGRDEFTSLLHGDLWSGNYLCGPDEQPVLLDPAIYRGCREAELGMIRLFGGCPADFEATYDRFFPMPDGWHRRVDVYMLFHVLNHLNLFGTSYLGQCRHLVARILTAT